MNKLITFAFYHVSLFPLWVSVLFIEIKSYFSKDYDNYTEILTVIALIFITISSLIIMLINMPSKGVKPNGYKTLLTVNGRRVLLVEFLLSNLLPLSAFNFTQWDGVVLFGFFYSIIAIININYRHLDPSFILELMGYRQYECSVEDKSGMVLIIADSSTHLKEGQKIGYKKLRNNVFMALPD